MVNILGQGETPEMVAKTMAPLRRALRVPDAGIHWYGKDRGDFVHRTCLVGDLEHDFYDFPYIGNVIIPTDELIFFRGVGRYTTNQMWICHRCLMEILWEK